MREKNRSENGWERGGVQAHQITISPKWGKNLCTCENTIWSLLSRCSFLLLFLHFFPLSSLLCLLSSLLTSFLLLYCFLLGFWFLSLLLSSNSFSFFFFFFTHFCFLSSHLSLVFVFVFFVFESGCVFFFFFLIERYVSIFWNMVVVN